MLAGSKGIAIVPKINVAIVSFSGMGHILPILQLAQCISTASEAAHMTVFTQVAARDLSKLPKKLPARTELVLMTEPSEDTTICNSLDFADRDLNGDHVRFIKGYFRERRTRPVIVVNGLLVYCGVELARHYRAKLWAFNASCLLSLTIYAVDVGRVANGRREPRNAKAANSKTSALRYGGEPPFARCQCSYQYHRGDRVAYSSPVIGDIMYEDMPVQPPPTLSIHDMFDKSFDVMVNQADRILCNDLTAFCFPEAWEAGGTGDDSSVLEHAFSSATLDAVWEKKVMSRVVNIGPLCAFDTRGESSGASEAVLWLDKHKPRSVVYVSLGSWCELSTPDLVRFCQGLAMCERPILWAFRGQSRPETATAPDPKLFLPRADENEVCTEPVTESGLPVGWEERMSSRLLLLPWVNQIEILSHQSVGCFVTHCGWNSMLEAITYSTLPLVGVPLGAEQAIDSRLIAEVFHSGVRVKTRLDDRVEAEVLDAAIREVMTRPRYTLNATRLHKIAFSQIGAGTRIVKQLFCDE